MFKNLKAKLLAGLATCACLFAGAGVGVNMANADDGGENTSSVTLGVEGEGGQSRTPVPTSGEGADGYSIEIVSKNVSYSDSIYILYAVDFAGFDESQNEVKMLFWDSLQTEYTVETAESVKSSKSVVTIGGRECIVFYSDGIAAKEMNDMLYCRAYASVDGVAVYSAVEKYSVVDYVYEKRTEGGLTNEQTAIFADMLDYGTSAQNLFGHNTGFPANATYYTVTVEGGVLDDGFTSGRYLPNATATMIAPEQNADGEQFTCWLDKDGYQIGDTATLSVTIRSNKYYVASYEALPEKPDTPELEPTPATAFRYSNIDSNTVKITGYIGEYTDIVIPEEIDGKVVTSIGSYAFYECSSLTSVVIPDSVTSIGNSAFEDCSSLTSVVIGDSVTSIGNSAFEDCSSLTSVVIGDSVTSIGNSAFRECSSLASVVIGNSVTSIGEMAFYECNPLVSVVLPDGVTSIGYGAFRDCSSLTDIVIPDSVTSIGSSAFLDCTNLRYNESDDAYYLGNESNPYLVLMKAKSGIIASCNIHTQTRIIYNSAFYYCTSLTSVKIPDSVTFIGSGAFFNCWNLVSVEIPDRVANIGSSTFEGCRSLTIYCEAESQPDGWDSNWNPDNRPVVWGYKPAMPATAFEYTSDGSAITITKYIGDYTDVVIPSTIDGLPVTSIGNQAFYKCSSLTSVVIPNAVTSIGNSAFFNCSSLTAVYISDIEAWCNISFGNSNANPLYYAKNLYLNGELVTELIIPDKVTEIKASAFYHCDSLTSVEIPDSVTSIGDYAFSGCSSLTSVEIPDSVTSIGFNAFWECSSLTSVVIGDSVTSIGNSAFSNCSSLTSVEIPNSVTSIGGNAFRECSNLTSVVIPDSVISIGGQAFYECSNLTSVVIPDSVTSIGDEAFAYCRSLTSVVIPDSVTSIGVLAFWECSSLTSVVIGDSVTSIGKGAFSNCSSLTSVVIPDSVISIGGQAFYECSNLTSVMFENPNGWWRASSSSATSGTAIDSADLSDTATAAQYLRSTYYSYYWKRSE